MKRVLSLILVLVLALGSVPFAFAEEAAATKTAGETLKELKLVKGDEEGNLNEEGMLTRAEMMVMLSRLLGVEEEAMNYAIPSTSKDVEGHWAAKYIAYAEQVGKWTSGVGENMFGADQKVTTQMVAKFMLTALGHEANWDTAVADATALGLMKGIDAKATADISRADVFKASLNTIETPKKDSEVKLGVTLGVLKEEVKPVAALTGEIDAVTGSGNALVQIEFKAAVDMEAAAAATYVIVEKADAAKTIAVNKINVESDTIVTLETDAMTAGTAYKLSVAELSAFFTGVAKETSAPKVSSVKGMDTNLVDVKFDKVMDKATAEDIANYSINTIGTVVKAELKSDRKSVELTTEGFTKVAAHKLTVENVLSVDGKMVAKTTKTFYPTFDKSSATIEAVKNVNTNNNKEIYVFFKDAHGVDEAAAEDISNYSIDGLEIISATAAKKAYDSSKSVNDAYSKTSTYYNRVTLVTSEQKANSKYTLKVNNIIDGSTAKNAPTKELSKTFYGGTADKTAPSVQNIAVLSSTLIRVTFQETNKLDPSTAVDISNYSIDKDALSIVDAKFQDDDEDLKAIDITVSEMENNKSYKLKVNNIADTFGNSMSKETTRYFQGKVVKSAPIVSQVNTSGLTKVVVQFSDSVTNTAKEATNYSLDGGVGAPTAAKFQVTNNITSTTTVELTFPELTANKTYKLTVNGVENHSGFGVADATKSFVASRTVADYTKPTVTGVSFTNKGLLRVDFSESMTFTGTANITISGVATSTTYDAKYVVGENKETITFDVESLNDNASQIAGDKVAYIMSFANVTDLAGNKVNYTAKTDSFTTDSVAFDAATDSVKVVGWSQESVTKVRIFFNADVVPPTTDITSISGKTFVAESDENDKSVVILTTKTGTATLVKDEEIVFDLSGDVKDLAGRAVAAYTTKAKMFIKDTTAPTLLEVVAIDKNTFELTYDEELSSPGSYSLKEGTTAISVSASLKSDKTKVKVTTTTALDSSKFYVVKQGTPARDLSNNYATVVTDGFEFVGSDADAATTTIAGVSVINGYTVQLKDTANLLDGTYVISSPTPASTVTKDALLVSGTDHTATLSNSTSKSQDLLVNKLSPFIKGKTYTVTVPSGYSTTTTTFTGIVERDTLSQETASIKTSNGVTAQFVVKLNGLASENGYTVLVGNADTASNGAITLVSQSITADEITFAANISAITSGTNIIVTVLDDSGNPVRTSEPFAVKVN